MSLAQQFFVAFLQTQAFAQFTLERVVRMPEDYEVLFFDETIKAKVNRSVMKINKSLTKFLDVRLMVCRCLVVLLLLLLFSWARAVGFRNSQKKNHARTRPPTA